MKTVAMEIARVKNQAGVKVSNKFSERLGALRSSELNTFQEGDIFQIPDPDAADFTVIEQPVRGSEQTYEYNVINVTRGNSSTVANLTPGLFAKSRQEAGADNLGNGNWHYASGSAVDAYKEMYDTNPEATIEDFYRANKGKKVKITGINRKFKSPRFGGNGVQMAWVPTLNFVD